MKQSNSSPVDESDEIAVETRKYTCDGCGGRCCQYFAVEIDAPEDEEDYDTIRWYLAHEAWVFYEDEGWYLYIRTPCKYLSPEGLCTIYNERMQICREHSNDGCERWEVWEPDKLFKTVEEWEVYADRKLKKSWKKIKKSKRRKKHRKMRWLIDRDASAK